MDLSAFLKSDAGLGLTAILVVAFLDFATGVFAALRDGTFALDALAAFVRKHIWGRVAPIGLLLVVGYFGGPAGSLFLAAAIAAAAAYAAESVASIWGNVNPPKVAATTKAERIAEVTNPVPTE
jgi:hypothetical protein